MKIRVFIVDDHKIVREGLKRVLSHDDTFEIIGEAGDGREALIQIEEIKPDIVILDIALPTMSGIEIARRLRRYHKEIRLLILSQYETDEFVDELLEVGICAYVLKDDAGTDLAQTINECMQDDLYLSPRLARRIVTRYLSRGKNGAASAEAQSQFKLLSDREREILKLLAEGHTNHEIATKLFIAANTVKVHRANIMKKLGAENLAELIKYAIKNHLIEL